jgi:histidyl-tRNA synthetase
LLGDDEAKSGSAIVRNLDSKVQETVALSDVPRYFLSVMKGF